LIIHMVSEHASPLAALGGADAGGQNVHVAALATALGRRGHEVIIHTRRDGAGPDRVPLAPGVTVEHVPAGPSRPVPKDELLPYMGDFAEHLGRRWRAGPPDVVHGHFWMSGLAALAATHDLAVPVAQTFHALGIVKRRHQSAMDTSPAERTVLEAQIARQVDRVVATCSDELRELCALGVRSDRVDVVPCGADLGRFRPDGPVAPRGWRMRVLGIGRLVPRKGVDTVIEAMAAVPGAEYVVAGGPAPEDLDEDPEVRRLCGVAAAHGVTRRVLFLGRVPHEDVPALIRSADVVVSVPWYEPFGIAAVEAMACGKPVIGSAVGGHLDTIAHGVTGLHVPARDPVVLARWLRTLLADGHRRAALGRAAAERAHGRYSWDRIAAQTEAVYERMIAPAAPRPVAAKGEGHDRRTSRPAGSGIAAV
jgi:glycosyltransferase involved in cell wall biosynthesis